MKVKSYTPGNLGWLEVKLDPFSFDHLWKCIDEAKGESLKHRLAGQIENSFAITDIDDYFFKRVVKPLCDKYVENWGASFTPIPVEGSENYVLKMDPFWVNYQNQHEYNPVHDHNGLFSFVVWMKIPTVFEEQIAINNSKGSNNKLNSAFVFDYVDILGGPRSHSYPLGPSYEGMMVFFPSKLRHQVYPYYNCDEQRISISGNLILTPRE